MLSVSWNIHCSCVCYTLSYTVIVLLDVQQITTVSGCSVAVFKIQMHTQRHGMTEDGFLVQNKLSEIQRFIFTAKIINHSGDGIRALCLFVCVCVCGILQKLTDVFVC